MTIITMTLAEIRNAHFYDAHPIDDLPGITCPGLLAPFDDMTTEALENDLFGWSRQSLGCNPLHTLWYSTEHRAAVVYSSHEIYLFTFENPTSFAIHLEEIRNSFKP
jgi:hypothetical protein